MKQYPSIPHYDKSMLGETVLAFDKIDGSNLRFEWNKKNGWNKFGTRRTMLDKSDQLYVGVDLFLNKYSEKLEKIFKEDKTFRGIKEVIVFCEIFGDESSFGQHNFEKPLDVVLLDVNPVGKGFIPPREFLKTYGKLGIPTVVYDGILTKDVVDMIRKSDGLQEGVVCKWTNNKHLLMTKIKTNKWINTLKENYGQAAVDEEFGTSVPIT